MKSGYKKTEVGVIPEDWDAVRLCEVTDLQVGFAFKSEWFGETVGTRLLRGENVGYGRADWSDMRTLKTKPDSSFRAYLLNPGDIVIGMDRTFTKTGSKITILVDEDCPCLLVQRVGRFIPRKCDNRFLWFVLSSGQVQSRLRLEQKGMDIPHLSRTEILHPMAAFPLPPEQRVIAEVLGDVDALLGSLDRLIAKKRDLKQAAMQQLLTGQTRLPGFNGEWKNVQVQDVITGFFCGPSPTCEERNIQDDDEWGVLKTTAATRENGWDWTKHKTLPRVFWNKPHLELKKGDVIVTKAGPRHRVGVTAWVDYVPPRIIVSGKMIGLRPCPDEVVPLMLAAAISAREPQVYLDQRTTGMAESQVNFENRALLEAPIRIPRIEEQTAIAEVLTDMDAELAALEQRRQKTRALKQSMMQELLTGRTRLVGSGKPGASAR